MAGQSMSKVIARDRGRGRSLVGGVGFGGCGTMWYEDSPHFASKEGYEGAPERDSWGQFGTPEESAKTLKCLQEALSEKRVFFDGSTWTPRYLRDDSGRGQAS
jgi:hypothetical protein